MISGWLYAHFQRAANPTPFGAQAGIEYLFIAVVGGAGYVWGAVVGAGLITILKQWLQDWLPRIFGASGSFEVIVFGIMMVLVLQRAREGLWPILVGLWPAGTCPRRVPQAEVLPKQALPAPGTVLLEVSDARKAFGGLIACNDMSLHGNCRRGVGADRPQWRGQEHPVQRDLRRSAAHLRRLSASWASASMAWLHAKLPGEA